MYKCAASAIKGYSLTARVNQCPSTVCRAMEPSTAVDHIDMCSLSLLSLSRVENVINSSWKETEWFTALSQVHLIRADSSSHGLAWRD